MDVVKNFAKVIVSTGYASGATSVTLQTGHGVNLPDPSVDGDFNLVWWNATDYPNPADDAGVEIVRCTARAGDVLTVTRAQELTLDANHNVASKTYQMILSLTKKMIDDIVAELAVRLSAVIEDLTPQLGGNLDMNGHNIGGNTEAQIDAAVTNTHIQGTDTTLGAQAENLDMNTHKIVGVVDPTADQEGATKKYVDDNSINNVVEDTTPQLGGNLDLQTNKVVGEGGADGVYVDNDGNVGLFTILPGYRLDVRSNGLDSQMHVSRGSFDDGGYLTSLSDESLYMSNGVAYNASLGGWVAKTADSSVLGATGDTTKWYSASNKTPGNAISLQLNVEIRPNGLYIHNPGSPAFVLQSGYDSHYGILEWRKNSGSTRGAFLGWGTPGSYLQFKLEDGNDLAITDGDVGLDVILPTAKLDIDSDKVRLRTSKTPATAGAAGNQGDICWDSDFLYVCVATNTWKRSALSTW